MTQRMYLMKMAYETIFWDGNRVKKMRTVLGLTKAEFAHYIQIPETAIRDHEKNKYARGWWSQIEKRITQTLFRPDSLLTKRLLRYKSALLQNKEIMEKARFDEELAFYEEIIKHLGSEAGKKI